jgi:hypothetical protein
MTVFAQESVDDEKEEDPHVDPPDEKEDLTEENARTEEPSSGQYSTNVRFADNAVNEFIMGSEEEARQWRDRMDVFSLECLFTMRGFVPPHIFSASLASLKDTDGLSEPLAKRLLSKTCLWLVRMNPEDIQKLHDADLFNRFGQLVTTTIFISFHQPAQPYLTLPYTRFNPQGQGLDVVELTAVYACLPAKFLDDPGDR